MKIDNFRDILTDANYAYYLHGTGAGDDNSQVRIIDSIFKKGLRASHKALYWTSVSYGTGENMNNNWDRVKNDMNHWPHQDSKNIIIVRVPIKYLIIGADESFGERDYAIYNEEVNSQTEQVTRFVNPKLVVGCYRAETGDFILNPNFESELSSETESELQRKYQEGVKLFQERISQSSFIDLPSGFAKNNKKKEKSSKKVDDEEEIDFSHDWNDSKYWEWE